MPKICFYCKKLIEDRYWMEPIEGRLYGNLFFHKDCIAAIDNRRKYLEEHQSEFEKYYKELDKR